jgi:hypothetical protein
MTDETDQTQDADMPIEGPIDAAMDTASHARYTSLWVAIAATLAVALAVGGLWWWREERSPAASIVRAAKAAVNRDVDAVEAAIDTSAVISSAVDDMYNDPHFRQSYVDSYTARHPGVKPEQIKARIGALVTEEVREHVSAGTLPKRIPLPADSLKALVAQAYARHSVKSITVKGNYAFATVAVPYHGKTYKVIVRLRRSGGDWVVDRIENLAEVLKQAGY